MLLTRGWENKLDDFYNPNLFLSPSINIKIQSIFDGFPQNGPFPKSFGWFMVIMAFLWSGRNGFIQMIHFLPVALDPDKRGGGGRAADQWEARDAGSWPIRGGKGIIQMVQVIHHTQIIALRVRPVSEERAISKYQAFFTKLRCLLKTC